VCADLEFRDVGRWLFGGSAALGGGYIVARIPLEEYCHLFDCLNEGV
jgi:hypothetical protein